MKNVTFRELGSRTLSTALLMAIPAVQVGARTFGLGWGVSVLLGLLLAAVSTGMGVALSKSTRFKQHVHKHLGDLPADASAPLTTWRLVEGYLRDRSLTTPPGSTLGRWLRMIFGKRVYQRLLEQHLVDHGEEWVEAHASGELWLARWIRVRCWIVVLWTVLGALPIEQIKALLLGGFESKKSAKED
jgi:hypothetical protein